MVVSVGDNARALHRISASGYQAHTTSPSASAALVCAPVSVHRIPLPTSVTIAKRPSCGGGTRGKMLLICPTAQANASATCWHDGQISSKQVIACQARNHLAACHGRARPGHPRLWRFERRKAWMRGTSPRMTVGEGRAQYAAVLPALPVAPVLKNTAGAIPGNRRSRRAPSDPDQFRKTAGCLRAPRSRFLMGSPDGLKL